MFALRFTSDQVEALQRGELTRYCIPVRKSEVMPETVLRSKVDAELRPEVWRYGHREFYAGKWLVAVCGGRQVGDILIRNIRRRPLQDMNSHDTQACGFYRVLDFKKHWDSEYKHKPFQWDANPDVWVLEIVYYTKTFTTAPLVRVGSVLDQA